MVVTDHVQEVKALEAQIELLQHENTQLLVAVREHCEAFGHEANDACGLHDVRNQIERLLAGHDLDNGIDYHGITGEIEALVWLAQFSGTDDEKTEEYFARLSYPKRDAGDGE